MSQITVSVECAQRDGYVAVYIRLREGKAHSTVEVSSTITADVGRDGELLGVEAIKTFRPGKRKAKDVIDLNVVRKALERRFRLSLEDQFEEVRFASDIFAPS